jgi:hypothetical protein
MDSCKLDGFVRLEYIFRPDDGKYFLIDVNFDTMLHSGSMFMECFANSENSGAARRISELFGDLRIAYAISDIFGVSVSFIGAVGWNDFLEFLFSSNTNYKKWIEYS